MKERLLKIDVLKGIAIVLVVIGHLIYQSPEQQNTLLFKLIYSFHVPLFMFLSGFLTYGKEIKIKKKFLTLVIPFLVWYLIKVLIISGNLDLYKIIVDFKDLMFAPDIGLWFLWVLFLIFCVFKIIQVLAQKTKDYSTIMTFLAVNLLIQIPQTSFLGLHLLQMHFVYWGVGFYFAKYRKQFKKNTINPILLIVLFILLLSGWKWSSPPDLITSLNLGGNYHTSWLIDPLTNIYKFLTAIIAIGILWISLSEKQTLINGILSFIGRWTIGIYALHWYFLFGESIFIKFISTLVISILISIVISKVRLLSVILLGDRK